MTVFISVCHQLLWGTVFTTVLVAICVPIIVGSYFAFGRSEIAYTSYVSGTPASSIAAASAVCDTVRNIIRLHYICIVVVVVVDMYQCVLCRAAPSSNSVPLQRVQLQVLQLVHRVRHWVHLSHWVGVICHPRGMRPDGAPSHMHQGLHLQAQEDPIGRVCGHEGCDHEEG